MGKFQKLFGEERKLENKYIFDKFTSEFNFKFDTIGNNNIKYYPGHSFTSAFSLVPGYRVFPDGTTDFNNWDGAYIHVGVDRDGQGDTTVYCPIPVHSTSFIDYEGKGYGSLIRLINLEYDIEIRIAHMNPSDIRPSVMRRMKNSEPIEKNEAIGKVTHYGLGTGAHLHTEVVSANHHSSAVLDRVLKLLYGDDSVYDYTLDEVERVFRSQPYFADKEQKVIMDTWQVEKNRRRIIGVCNQYKFLFRDWFAGDEPGTRYSSYYLFGM
jgi:hypothetical protein